MNIENLTENIESVIECAEAIKNELKHNSGEHEEAIQLYEDLDRSGVTTDADEIVASVELVADLSSDNADEINSALELWESVNGSEYDTDHIGDALEIYAIAENSPVCTSKLEGSLRLVEEWNQHCAHTWADPETVTAAYEELSNIVEVFSTAFGVPIYGVDEANKAVCSLGITPAREEDRDIIAVFERVVGFSIQSVEGAENALNLMGVSNEERALLDAISALCVKQAGTNAVPSAVNIKEEV